MMTKTLTIKSCLLLARQQATFAQAQLDARARDESLETKLLHEMALAKEASRNTIMKETVQRANTNPQELGEIIGLQLRTFFDCV